MKKKHVWTVAVCIAAVLLWMVQQAMLTRQKERLSLLQTEVENSIAAWQATDEAKTSLQTELTRVSNDLREAELTIEENSARILQLNDETAALRTETAELTANKETTTALIERMTSANTSLVAYLEGDDVK